MTADAVGGVWTYAMELARGLTAQGSDVLLAVLGPLPSAGQRAEAGNIAGLTLATHGGKLEWMADSEDDLTRQGAWLLGLERRFEPEMVHLNGYAQAALAWHAPTLVVAHSCVGSWWHACRAAEAPAEWDDYRRRVRAGLSAAAMVVAPTQAILDEISVLYGAPQRAAVIANGRDGRRFPPLTKRHYVMGCGRFWDEAKNLSALAAAARSVPWPVMVAGALLPPDGAGAPSAPDTILWLGPQTETELARCMGQAAIFAHPARYEPFGLAVLEAAFARCALVLGDIPSLRELWDGAAEFVSPDRPDELARALRALMVDEGRRDALALAASERASRFTAARMVSACAAAYAMLVAERTPLEPAA